MFIHKFQLTLAIAVSLTYLCCYPISVQTQPSILVQNNPPDGTQKPPPPNKRASGGTLSGSTLACQNNSNKVIALVPIQSDKSLTISTHPTFWFYIPLAAEDIEFGRFSLATRDNKQRIYRTEFKLPKTPGIVSISLPSQLENPLKEGEYYQWNLELYCKSNTDSPVDFEVNGWLKRVTPETKEQIWFDTLNRLAELRRSYPEDEKIKNDWLNLLKSVELQDLVEKPIVGQVELINNSTKNLPI